MVVGTDRASLADVVDTSSMTMKAFESALKETYKLGYFCTCRPKLVNPLVSISFEIVFFLHK